MYNHRVHIFMPDWVSTERVKLMLAYGADVTQFSESQGGFIRCVQEAKAFADNTFGVVFTNQFSNHYNYLAHYETTGKEIIEQVPEKIGGFVSGVGTGGTLMGIGDRIKETNKQAKTVAIEPETMPIISKGVKLRNHKIEGIGDDFVLDLINKEKIDKIILINDEDAINMSRKLAKELGIGVGISSGANLIGSILLKEEIDDSVVTVFPDDKKKYLSTDLLTQIKDNKDYISNQVELINFEVI